MNLSATFFQKVNTLNISYFRPKCSAFGSVFILYIFFFLLHEVKGALLFWVDHTGHYEKFKVVQDTHVLFSVYAKKSLSSLLIFLVELLSRGHSSERWSAFNPCHNTWLLFNSFSRIGGLFEVFLAWQTTVYIPKNRIFSFFKICQIRE